MHGSSTDGQTLDAQVAALTAAGAARVFRETASGAKTDRRELARAITPFGDGDTLLVTRLDRLARSTRDLLNILDTVAKAGAGFRSLGDAWADTTTPHGRLMLTVLGGLAEFDRDLIRARTGEGRKRAKARGVPMGRPPKVTAASDAARRRRRSPTARRRKPTWRGNSMSAKARFHGWPKRQRRLRLPPTGARRRRRNARRGRFCGGSKASYPVIEGLLYGSRARGDHKPGQRRRYCRHSSWRARRPL